MSKPQTKMNKSKKSSKSGYVYILTNPSFREDWVKVGKSARPVDVRSKELDNTAVPLPFKIFATVETRKYDELEKNFHASVDCLNESLRVRKNREFFNINPQTALELLEKAAKLADDDAKITKYEDNEPILAQDAPAKKQKPLAKKIPVAKPRLKTMKARMKKPFAKKISVAKPKSPPFKFSMVGIKKGEKIIFTPTKISVTVASDNEICYKGALYKLSPFVREFMPKNRRNSSGAYQGAKYFTYKGKVLDDLRTRAGK